MKDLEYLKILDDASSLASLNRADHVRVQEAVNKIKERLEKLQELEKAK